MAKHSEGESRAPHTLSLTDMKSVWHDDTYKIIKRHTKPTKPFVRSAKEGQSGSLRGHVSAPHDKMKRVSCRSFWVFYFFPFLKKPLCEERSTPAVHLSFNSGCFMATHGIFHSCHWTLQFQSRKFGYFFSKHAQ